MIRCSCSGEGEKSVDTKAEEHDSKRQEWNNGIGVVREERGDCLASCLVRTVNNIFKRSVKTDMVVNHTEIGRTLYRIIIKRMNCTQCPANVKAS